MSPRNLVVVREESGDAVSAGNSASAAVRGGDAVLRGRVRWYNPQKGYGFVDTDDGREVFVRYTVIEMDGYKALEEDQAVDLELTPTDRGLEASRVRVLG